MNLFTEKSAIIDMRNPIEGLTNRVANPFPTDLELNMTSEIVRRSEKSTIDVQFKLNRPRIVWII